MGKLRSKRKVSAIMPEEESLNTISCEVCRQRKCKCDRRLPFCSQCASEPSKCIYPESGKRGLPLGYINHLEQRLAETESALYGALTTLRSLGQPTTPVSAKETTPKQKAARMEEWSGLPLRDAKDMQHWLCIMSDRFSIEPAGPGNAPIAIPIPETPANHTLDEPQSGYWRDGRVTESPFETHPTGTIALPYFGMNEVIPDSGLTDDAVGVSGDANSVDRSTRAEELSHKNPNLYF